MADRQTEQTPEQQVEATRKAFEQEFERFARFTSDSNVKLLLNEAIAEERALSDLRTRLLGKKSDLAAAKKQIGRVAPDVRAAFGQLVQSVQADMLAAFDRAEENLKQQIEEERTARESIDVSLPGRRPPYGHRHPITILPCARTTCWARSTKDA